MTDLPPPPPPPPGFLPPSGSPPATASWSGPDDQAANRLEGARWGQRAGALVLDVLIQLAIAIAIGVLVAVLTGGSEFSYETEDPEGTFTMDTLPYWAAWGMGSWFLLLFVYPWLVLGLMRGRTPGRRIAGIRVVNRDATPVRTGKAFLREGVVKGALGLFGLPLLVSYLWPLWDPHQRALHDLVCSTRVVQEGTDATDAFGGPPTGDPVAQAPPRTPTDRDDLAGQIGLGG